ncbi:MAG: hypothetical protein P9M14_05475 [Candidatus Alcyoniella australis]|nr:hypothetical protein [Candidatus Alcyoniella australis]
MLRRTIPIIICFAAGWALILSAYIPHHAFANLGEEFSVFFDIIAVFAFVLGAGNLIKIMGNRIYKRSKGWGYAVVALAGFFFTLLIGLFKLGNPGGITAEITAAGSLFDTVYLFIFAPLSSTMFALLAFYVASASYRAFRAKNRDATILLVSAFIILIGRTFIGSYITSWLPANLEFLSIPSLANWVMRVPNLAGQRAIMIGIALGIISTSLRLILGVERSYLGSDVE